MFHGQAAASRFCWVSRVSSGGVSAPRSQLQFLDDGRNLSKQRHAVKNKFLGRTKFFFGPVRVPEIALRRDKIADALLQFSDLWKAAFFLARSDGRVAASHDE